jgi:hypothetical protein
MDVEEWLAEGGKDVTPVTDLRPSSVSVNAFGDVVLTYPEPESKKTEPVVYKNDGAAIDFSKFVPDSFPVLVGVARGNIRRLGFFLFCLLVPLLVFRGFCLSGVFLSLALSFSCPLLGRLALSFWRTSSWRRRIYRPLVPVEDVPEEQVAESLRSVLTDPVVHDDLGLGRGCLSVVDGAFQCIAVSTGYSGYVQTARVAVMSRHLVTKSTFDIRPSHSRGAKCESDRVTLMVAELQDPYERVAVKLMFSPEMVNVIQPRSDGMNDALRRSECHNIASRISNLMIPSTMCSEIQRGSGMIARLISSNHDVSSSVVSTVLQDFRGGSSSIRLLGLDIVPLMASPFLLFLGTVLLSPGFLTFMLRLVGL